MSDQGSLALPIPKLRPRFPAEPIVRTAEIDGCYRWTATRAWGAGPCVLWCLLNPSVADGKRDDPTMRRMIGFSYRWGFGSMIVTNIYPFVSPNTKALRAWRESWELDGEVHHDRRGAWLKNHDVVSSAIDKATTYIAAWGNEADRADVHLFMHEVGRPIGRYQTGGEIIENVEWMCLGLTGIGNPIHPLARGYHWVPDDAVLQTWRT